MNRRLSQDVFRQLPDVFKKWIRDDIEREQNAYYNDTSPYHEKATNITRDNFEPERFIKSELDIKECEQIMLDHFRLF